MRTFSELNDVIQEAVRNKEPVVKLDHDYEYDSLGDTSYKDGVPLDHATLIIDGQGHVLDGLDGDTEGYNSFAVVFDLLKSNIILKNIYFVTASSTRYIKGGAVNAYNSHLTLINCTFIKTGATYNSSEGGAIRSEEGYLSVINCVFDRCISGDPDLYTDGEGGAIYCEKSLLSVVNSQFVECSGEIGGAIWSDKRIFIDHSTFEKSGAPQQLCNISRGGAIYSEGVISLHACKFIENTSVSYGGAISCLDDIIIRDSTFERNSVTNVTAIRDSKGGAVHSEKSVDARNVRFLDNTCLEHGGAIYSKSGDINKCVFERNQSYRHGGSIYCDSGIYRVYDSSFTENKATNDGSWHDAYGGAMYMYYADLSAHYNNFEHNSAEHGSAIYCNDRKPIVRNNWWGTPNPNWDNDIINVDGTFRKDESPWPVPFLRDKILGRPRKILLDLWKKIKKRTEKK